MATGTGPHKSGVAKAPATNRNEAAISVLPAAPPAEVAAVEETNNPAPNGSNVAAKTERRENLVSPTVLLELLFDSSSCIRDDDDVADADADEKTSS